jgi:alpha/beta superfamily hydrolase
MTRAARATQSWHVAVAGEVGTLESVVEQRAEAPNAVAVICHPHPLHGGTMNNKVVTTLARSLARGGAVSVRFNFRGVGDSGGSHDGEDGELADAVAVTDWAIDEFGGSLPLVIAGFSFGGAIAYRTAAARSASALITVAPAIDRIPVNTPEPVCDWLLVQGSADEVIAPDAVAAWLDSRSRMPTQIWLPGVGHFFHGQLDALSRAVNEFIGADQAIA